MCTKFVRELAIYYQSKYDYIVDNERVAKFIYRHPGYKKIKVPFTFTGNAQDLVYFMLNRETDTLVPAQADALAELTEPDALLIIDGVGGFRYQTPW